MLALVGKANNQRWFTNGVKFTYSNHHLDSSPKLRGVCGGVCCCDYGAFLQGAVAAAAAASSHSL